MKKILPILGFACLASNAISQTLPPVAQALYNECYNNNVTRGQYATTNGATAIGTADGNSFYLKWFPAGATPSLTPLMVTMHGTAGNAFDEFYLWHQKAAAKGVGIIAIQWYRGAAAVAPNDYFDDPVIYSHIDTALKRIKYPSNKAFLHGFSRGSARSYAVEFYDVRPGGKNYFCTIMSNSGKADSAYPLISQINSGLYGHTLFNGKRWGMFCGGLDPSALTNCTAMNNSKNWVQANGGNVGLYISDPNLPHGGFQQTPIYMDSALKYYLPCFTGLTGLKINKAEKNFNVFPNPSSETITISSNDYLEDYLQIINQFGTIVNRIKISGYSNKINISDLDKGLYLLVLGKQQIKFLKE